MTPDPVGELADVLHVFRAWQVGDGPDDRDRQLAAWILDRYGPSHSCARCDRGLNALKSMLEALNEAA